MTKFCVIGSLSAAVTVTNAGAPFKVIYFSPQFPVLKVPNASTESVKGLTGIDFEGSVAQSIVGIVIAFD